MSENYIDIMLDVETLGVGNSPVLLQIAAIPFDIETGETFAGFNQFINPKSCIKSGLEIDSGTVKFWLNEDLEAIQKVLIAAIESEDSLDIVLSMFSIFVERVENFHKKKVRVWGNGVLADNKWIESAYIKLGKKLPWKYNANSDVRTLVDLGKRLLDIDPKNTIEFTGTKHDAIDDCLHQIKYCSEIYKKLGKIGELK